jgi:exosortase
VLALGLFAYRPLLLETLHLPARSEVEHWFFTPEEKTPLLAIAIAGWLLWRRRARLLSLPDRGARGAALALLAIGVGLFVWAQLTRAADLLLPSLASNLLAFASATKGRAGCRAVLLPALVLLLGAPIPMPIRNELVWQLQNWSAGAATWAMQAAGRDVVLGGVLIRSGEYTFTVIESCSGLRGIEILTLVAVLIRELFATSGRRQWLLVLLAPGLGFVLNVLRVVAVVVVASSADPQAAGPGSEDHTPQGVAVLMVGTVLLYALGRGMAGSGWQRVHGARQRDPRTVRDTPQLRWRSAAVGLVALGAISVTVTPFRREQQLPPTLEIPKQRFGWSGEDLAPDRGFVGPLLPGHALYRHYEKKARTGPPRVVDLFVGFEVAGHRVSSRLFSSKIAVPGRDWSFDEARRSRVWALGIDADLAVASRESERALVYSWRVRDDGIWRETPRSMLALDSGPFRRQGRRAVVRLSTPLPNDGPVARDLAKKILDGFITTFRDELAGL